ncbi:hypothetical protein Glove_485g31 [Diversispora epigaea]|uniref:FAR1 domain-containing protein n=1 Tax=Diversispora epigaea TaxID=1348612 RepID=A0A397GPV9_9GLOM|nr:hypothetical protein Glove_485g31 [Diversispora epigaea]
MNIIVSQKTNIYLVTELQNIKIDNNDVHEYSLFAVSSSEEELSNVEQLQEEFGNSNSEDYLLFNLKTGDEFEDWNSVERQVKNHAIELGFEVVKRRLEKNKHGEIVRRTFECKNSHQYRPKKKADTEDTRECESVKINCLWRINFGLTSGIIRITSICKEHNHPLLKNRNIASNRRLSAEMLEEIEFLVSVGCGAGPIICALQKRFPDEIIHPKNVYNAICLFRRGQKIMKTDAAETYEKLIKQQREEHGWFVEARLEGEDNHLSGLFWMRPSQIELWQKFHDVAINDNTLQTNKYRMYLSLTIVVDNHARSRMAATAVVSDETKETYQ